MQGLCSDCGVLSIFTSVWGWNPRIGAKTSLGFLGSFLPGARSLPWKLWEGLGLQNGEICENILENQ